MECDLCGTKGTVFKTRIEGTVLTVCERCKGHGQVLEAAKPKQSPVTIRKPSASREQESILLVRDGFGKLIKAARERRGLKQEELAQQLGLKLSQLHKYETEAQKPDMETARRFERLLRITLVREHVEERGKAAPEQRASGLTIADLLKR